MFELVENIPQNAVIKVIGVGGGGGNAVHHMISNQVDGVEFICANTDAQALNNLNAKTILQMGSGITKGLGAGANPAVGRQAALEDRDEIAEILSGADMVFITAGMGGGTGTGAAPVIASIAKDLGALTEAGVTKPFKFEGKKRMSSAEKGLAALVEEVDSLVTIPNQKLYEILGEDTPMQDAFAKAKTDMIYLSEGVLSPSEVRLERGLDPEGIVEQQPTAENANISGGKDQDKSEESERVENRNLTGDREE